MKIITKLLLFLVLLGIFVVMLGAYTRLTDAGLGCPDWPGCYGHLVLPNQGEHLQSAQKAYPDIPIEQSKAWTEMVHRYIAGTLGLFIAAIFIFSIIKRFKRQAFPFLIPMILFGLLFFQAALGMWTVTLKLLPLVVMGHLLGGMTLVTLLWLLRLQLLNKTHYVQDQRFKPWVVFGLIALVIQISLGGWVSANYAGLSCIGFPFCNGKLIPQLNLAEAFTLINKVGENYQGGLLETNARITIQWVHRLGAMLVASYWLAFLSVMFFKGSQRLKRIAFISLTLIAIQFSLGVINVVKLLPLSIAVFHNGVALLLLLSVVTLLNQTTKERANVCHG